MKKLLVTISICLCSTLLFTGCGNKERKNSPSKNEVQSSLTESSEEEVSEIAENESTSENSGESEKESSTDSETTTYGTISATSIDVPTQASSMILSAHALALCETEKSLTYDSEDPNYFWSATAYLLAGYGIQSAAAEIDDDGILSLNSTGVKEFASSVFASYDGNSESLPDIPDGMTLISYDSENDTYKVAAGGFASTRAEFGNCTDNGDGTISVKVTLKVDDTDGEVLGTWDMKMKTSEYDSGHPLFNYSIMSFTRA